MFRRLPTGKMDTRLSGPSVICYRPCRYQYSYRTAGQFACCRSTEFAKGF
jgi:hypothetical protein